MIEPYYYDYWGNRVETSQSTHAKLLEAMTYRGVELQDEGERRLLPPVIVVRKGETPELPPGVARASVVLEDGSRFSGDLAALPLGYHEMSVRRAGGDESSTLIVAPVHCYLSQTMRDARVLAFSTQLYALRSSRNWGVGDFTDLKTLAAVAGRAGAGGLALNPLHELHPSNPQAASPYSPSSRLFVNVLYIDVERVAELSEAPHAQALIAREDFQARLADLRRAELVDYAAAATVKLELLERLYRTFLSGRRNRPNDRQAQSFRRFTREGGAALERLAVYETLSEIFRARNPDCYGWHTWPTEYRSPASPHVARFAREHRERVDFFIYMQWLARQQLAAAAKVAHRRGIALYCDLAVGVEPNGADAWADQQAIVTEAALGAPPDPLNKKGQNWGLAPFSPRALRAHAYQPFIALLRANMQYAGILRIDHVMALQRAFWIPRGAPASEGAYVRYPREELLGILALESVRHACAVVGEDLGTLPEGFRERLQDAHTLSTRVFYFERDWNGSFLPPQRYPRLAAASIGTHDLPTLAGWWIGDRAADEDRFRDRLLLVDALERAGVIDAGGASRLRDDASGGGTLAVVSELAVAAHRFLAATPSMLAVVAIEDVLNETGAVNVPGTFDEHPNWRRKRAIMLERIEADGRLAQTGRLFANR